MGSAVARIGGWLPVALLVFVAAAFALPSEPAYALVYYVVVVPCLVAHIVTRRRHVAGGAAAWLAVALVVWSGVTLLWGTDDGHRSWRFAGSALATLSFLAAALIAWRDAPQRARLRTVLVAAGACNAVFAIAVFVITHPVFPRLHGWGATSHVILGAAVMSVPALTALARVLSPTASWRTRIVHLAAFAVMAAFMLMTESRGPLLAGLAAGVFLCAASRWRLRAFAGLAGLIALWLSLPAAVRLHGETVLARRGSSHRFEIWGYTLRLIGERPLFGHGLAANLYLNVGDVLTFPHDLYLSLLFYSGAVGLLLFASLAGLLFWRMLPFVWRRRMGGAALADAEWPWLAALGIDGLMIGLTDLGQITKGPGPLWLILWIPLGLLIGATRREKAGGAVPALPGRPSFIRSMPQWR